MNPAKQQYPTSWQRSIIKWTTVIYTLAVTLVDASVDADNENRTMIVAEEDGVLLRAGYQALAGRITPSGLTVWSTVEDSGNENNPLRIISTRIHRQKQLLAELESNGFVELRQDRVRFSRPRVTEEFGVSMHGIRQDFIISDRPSGVGNLTLELSVSGAVVSQSQSGAVIKFPTSGREIAYHRLQVNDARGSTLPAELTVVSPQTLHITVDDSVAHYPIRIDPTFSDVDWVSMGGFPGANEYVDDMAIDSSGNVIVVGDFTAIGEVVANGIAKWDGDRWLAMDSGLQRSDGFDPAGAAIAVMGDDVFVGGYFTSAGGIPAANIAKWDGTTWSALGSGVNASVAALAVSGSDLYVGGDFDMAGGNTANHLARWDGANWSPLGTGINNTVTDTYVRTVVVSGGELYVGGSFTVAGGVTANSIAKWNGSAWSGFNDGLGNPNSEPYVSSIAVIGSDVYAGGKFSSVTGADVEKFARWDGAAWKSIPGFSAPSSSSGVTSLAAVGSDLYVSGVFGISGGSEASNLALWNGANLSPVAVDLQYRVVELASLNGVIHAVRYIDGSGGNDFYNISRLDAGGWLSFGDLFGFDGTILSMATSDTAVYVGGFFDTCPGGPAAGIAKWDGDQWSALGAGLNGEVRAIATSGDDVYVGGGFSQAGGAPANNIARWNGTAWSALGDGVDARVRAIVTEGNNVYAGGSFATAGSSSANQLAVWDGSTWSEIGGGVSMEDGGPGPGFGVVFSLLLSGTDLYVGGRFNRAGATAVSAIAKWDGSNWSDVGGGVSSGGGEGGEAQVQTMAMSNGHLYVGGEFLSAGGVNAKSIATWNGSSWSAMGGGFSEEFPEVETLVALGSEIYVGGDFGEVGGAITTGLAVWDGGSWSAVGAPLVRLDGFGSDVRALGILGSELFVAGRFDVAGSTVSPFLVIGRPGGGTSGPYVEFGEPGTVTVYLFVPEAGEYDILRATAIDAETWDTLGTVTASSGGVISFFDGAAPNQDAFYRAVRTGP